MNCTNNDKCNARYKHTPRSEATVANLTSRLNRVIGQLGGVKNMIDENRYCGDILVQLSAAESALAGISHLILAEHMETCVKDGIREGNDEVIGEVLGLIKKLK